MDRARDLAQQLLAYEAARLSGAERETSAVFRVSEKLRGSLSRLAGATGFSTLLARALTLARNHAPGTPGLDAIRVGKNGTLEGIDELESLVMRLVLDIWPDLLAVDPQPQQESET